MNKPQPTSKPQSKRRSERIPVSLPVHWIRRSGNVDTTCADINLHGMFVRTTDTSVSPGQLLQLRVELPEAPLDMFVIARFVGRSESGVGIGTEIFLMDEPAQTRWSQHYRSLAAAQKRALRPAAQAVR